MALQREHVGLCLTVASGENRLYSLVTAIIHYPLFFILSDGRGYSADHYSNVATNSLEISRFSNLLEAQTTLVHSINGRIQTPSPKIPDAVGKIMYIVNWWKQNSSKIPTTSHFSDSWFVGSNFVPAASKSNTLVDSAVSTFSESGSQTPEEILQAALDELNALEGLPSVKKEVGNLVSFLKIQQQRAQHGMKGSNQALHYVFTGNPGTGKTTVGRILAKVFYGFGILKTQKVTETDRSGLVGGYVGQTAIKTDEVIQNALDGVLFIDEAYTLSKKESGQDYGQEAIDTLLKRMEDQRDRLIVIAAGYPALMQQFIQSNPGLSSRFTRSITFDDYSAPEMCRIFANMCKKEEYTLPQETLAYVCVVFYLAHSQRDEHFGNARFVRNVYENTTMKQSSRLAAEHSITKQALATLEQVDIPFEMIPNFDVNGLDLSQSRWSGTCPGCQKSFDAKLDFIGQRVTCKQCGEKFMFPWWNPVPVTIGGVFPSEGHG